MPRLRRLPAFLLAAALAACAEGPLLLPGNVNAPPPQIEARGDALLTNTVWRWEGTLRPDGASLRPDVPANYTLEFQPGGKVNVRVDCNRGSGTYLLNGDALSFGPVALTKMLCPQASRDAEFVKELAAVTSQSFEGPDLVLTLSGTGGTMRFSTTRR